MGDKDGFAPCHLPHILENGTEDLAEELLVVAARVGCHLTEELVLRLVASRELRALVALGSHAADAEVGVPRLVAVLIAVAVSVEGVGGHLLRSTGGSAPGLVHEEDGVALAEEDVGPSLAAVGCRLPSRAALPIAVKEGHGGAAAANGNLIEGVGMIHVRRGALAAHVEPVLCSVVLTGHGSRDAAARREHALARDLQGAMALRS